MNQQPIKMTDFLTNEQIRAVQALYRKHGGDSRYATACAAEIITPALAEINRKLGQENDAKYLAYVCEYWMLEAANQDHHFN